MSNLVITVCTYNTRRLVVSNLGSRRFANDPIMERLSHDTSITRSPLMASPQVWTQRLTPVEPHLGPTLSLRNHNLVSRLQLPQFDKLFHLTGSFVPQQTASKLLLGFVVLARLNMVNNQQISLAPSSAKPLDSVHIKRSP